MNDSVATVVVSLAVQDLGRSPVCAALLDMVAVLHSASDPKIRARDVGTVVELLPRGALEGEFLSRDGRTRHIGTLSTDDVLVLNRERTRVAGF